ncbi:MAG: aminotransferase class III-fold pyridoxal phosphate-dependent enzyme, partial [Kiritimatiellae bacterium]|nr:aminotransferase class III-fold pyridoxal phosphate-dependent enzyme [Kiritimatiellia bacterium]
AVAKGELLKAGLESFVEKYDQALEVRGTGMMLGIVVDGDPARIVEAFRDAGVLALTAGQNVVRFLPTLSMKENHLEDAVEMRGDALEERWASEG